MNQSSRFDEALRRFKAVHCEDPQRLTVDGVEVPFALDYHQRLAGWLERLAPDAPEELRLAAWCQHLRRWVIPRQQYPDGVVGYKRWRSALAARHAEEAARILDAVGYDEATVARVADLVRKRELRSDPGTQLLEDAVCLAFIERELASFAARHPETKVVDILRKTWAKMTPRGQQAARQLTAQLPAALQRLLAHAGAETSTR